MLAGYVALALFASIHVVAGDRTILSCSQQRKNKAPAPAKQQQREADQVEDKAAK